MFFVFGCHTILLKMDQILFLFLCESLTTFSIMLNRLIDMFSLHYATEEQELDKGGTLMTAKAQRQPKKHDSRSVHSSLYIVFDR